VSLRLAPYEAWPVVLVVPDGDGAVSWLVRQL